MIVKPTIMLVILTALVLAVHSEPYCTLPQRVGSMSFSTLSKRDHLSNMFQTLNEFASNFNLTTTVNGTYYRIESLLPQYYYNDNNQKDEFVDPSTSKVSGGQLTMAFFFNYSVGSSGRGTARGKVAVDPFTFTKQIQVDKGYIEWNPVQVDSITVSTVLSIETSAPKMSDADRRAFENILNDHSEQRNTLKEDILKEVNVLYNTQLKKTLNNQKLINSDNIVYTYKPGQTLTYSNSLLYMSLYNTSAFAGLKYQYLFELPNYTKECNILPLEPLPGLGGVQEILGRSAIKAAVYYGLRNAWFDTKLSSSWDSEIFQFYMGDIANAIKFAETKEPSQPVIGTCNFDRSYSDISVQSFFDKYAFVIPYQCSLISGEETIQNFIFNATFLTDFIATQDHLDVYVNTVAVNGLRFTSSGNYVVTSPEVASYYVLHVLRNAVERKKTFGSGFPILSRKKPQLRVTPDYVVIYDTSEK